MHNDKGIRPWIGRGTSRRRARHCKGFSKIIFFAKDVAELTIEHELAPMRSTSGTRAEARSRNAGDMRTLCMAHGFRGTTARALLLSALLPLPSIGCSRPTMASTEEICPPLELLEAIQKDHEIERYATGFFEKSRLLVLWDDMPTKLEDCNVGGHIRFTRSSTLKGSRNSDFILIEKMYFDADAAFVNVYLHPSGKNIDASLRKRDGRWQVTQRSLWEN